MWLLPGVLVAGLSVWVALDWRRGSEEAIRQRLLAEAPPGASMRDVLGMIERHGWEIGSVDEARGFDDGRTRPPRVVGRKSIRASLGDYRSLPVPLPTTVTVFWGFDEAGRLIDVWVWKTTAGSVSHSRGL